jgi:hypothetical protein
MESATAVFPQARLVAVLHPRLVINVASLLIRATRMSLNSSGSAQNNERDECFHVMAFAYFLASVVTAAGSAAT